jgi:hypothetical protein
MAVRHAHNQGITVVDDRTGGRGSNKVNVFSSLDNTAVNQEVERVRTHVMSGSEDKNSDSTVTTDVSVGMSARKMQDLVTNVIATLRTDTVTMTETTYSTFQAECSNLRSDIVTLTGSLKGDRLDLPGNEC